MTCTALFLSLYFFPVLVIPNRTSNGNSQQGIIKATSGYHERKEDRCLDRLWYHIFWSRLGGDEQGKCVGRLDP